MTNLEKILFTEVDDCLEKRDKAKSNYEKINEAMCEVKLGFLTDLLKKAELNEMYEEYREKIVKN